MVKVELKGWQRYRDKDLGETTFIKERGDWTISVDFDDHSRQYCICFSYHYENDLRFTANLPYENNAKAVKAILESAAVMAVPQTLSV